MEQFINIGMGQMGFGMPVPAWMLILLPLIALWSLLCKALALWHSAQRGEWGWFVVLVILNTAGILEVIYLFFVAKLTVAQLFTSKVHLKQ